MKNILVILGVMIGLIGFCANGAFAITTWYVDSLYGNDGYSGDDPTEPFRTIKKVLDMCYNGDTIELKAYADYLPDQYDSTYVKIVRSELTIQNYYIFPNDKPTIVAYVGAPEDSIDTSVTIENTYATIKKIKFDGYHLSQYVPSHITIWIKKEADDATITECEFRHFGNDGGIGSQFQAVISGDGRSDNSLDDLFIDRNLFTSNDFDTPHGHEIYLCRTLDAVIYGNNITSNQDGYSVMLRNDCQNTVIDGNTIQNTYTAFVHDYFKAGEIMSSNTTVTDNTFSGTVSSYHGPCTVLSEGTGINIFNGEPHISEFWGNSIYEISTEDYITAHSVACEDTVVYLAVSSSDSTRVYKFRNIGGPIVQRLGERSDSNYKSQGDMCTTNSYIIVSTFNGTNYKVYKFNKAMGDTAGFIASTIESGSTSTRRVTGLSTYDGSYFLTAVRVDSSDSTFIYKSSDSNLTLNKLWSSGVEDSVTAITYDGTYVVFATYDSQGRGSIWRGTISNNILTANTIYGPTSGKYISTLCFCKTGASKKLMIAVKTTSPSTSVNIYYETLASPLSLSNSTTDSFSSSTNILSLAGNSDYLYMVKHNDVTNDAKRLYYTDVTSQAAKDKLFYSKWWASY